MKQKFSRKTIRVARVILINNRPEIGVSLAIESLGGGERPPSLAKAGFETAVRPGKAQNGVNFGTGLKARTELPDGRATRSGKWKRFESAEIRSDGWVGAFV